MRFDSAIICLLFVVSASISAQAKVEGMVKADGSSTVFPLTEAVAEEFGKLHPKVRVVVGSSGTGGGFKKFIMSEIDINNASRVIKSSEAAEAKKKGVHYIELAVAHDGITIVVNKANTWVDKLTVAELKKIWEPGSKVKTWKDVRATWPDRPIKLYGPGTDSGTFDFFTEAINGKAQASRSEFTKSEDDNVLIQGVEGDKDSLGYFGYSYYAANEKKLKAVPVDNGKGAVMPTPDTINNETYAPLSRILYVYVTTKALARPEVKEFMTYYMANAAKFSKDVGYVPLSVDKYKTGQDKLKPSITKK
jgi:phosphate transport system substrate-binding protein